jgi:hypothetical protein
VVVTVPARETVPAAATVLVLEIVPAVAIALRQGRKDRRRVVRSITSTGAVAGTTSTVDMPVSVSAAAEANSAVEAAVAANSVEVVVAVAGTVVVADEVAAVAVAVADQDRFILRTFGRTP